MIRPGMLATKTFINKAAQNELSKSVGFSNKLQVDARSFLYIPWSHSKDSRRVLVDHQQNNQMKSAVNSSKNHPILGKNSMITPKRIGLLIPNTDTTLEADLQRTFTPNASIHSQRILLKDVTEAAEREMVEVATPNAIPLLKPIKPDIVVFGCTSAGALYGIEGEKAFTKSIADAFEKPVLSAFGSVTKYIQDNNINKLALFTPYTDNVHQKVANSLQEMGVEIVWNKNLGLSQDFDIGKITPTELHQLISESNLTSSNADALFLSCTNLRAVETIDSLQEAVGIPIFSSNLAIIKNLESNITL